ncbi:MAG: GlmU family protein [Cyclobacteriaceae bacterium]|jgi:UDP-N-acetylglucosamine diphosphorylase/glucosamine-1-phosphate N-acetyltransferase|nr:GlmU family protein [Cyclobacteriaceae bacterium]
MWYIYRMNVILFDDPSIRVHLLPFTFTRPVADIRSGILTIREKWERWLKADASFLTEDYLSGKYPLKESADNLLINGALCPDEKLIDAIRQLPMNASLVQGEYRIAMRASSAALSAFDSAQVIEYAGDIDLIDRVWKIFQRNGARIRSDFHLVTKGKTSYGVQDKPTIVYNEENVFVEEGATIRAAVLNAENGPIYIGKKAIIQEGALIRGPFAMCEGGHVNMGAKVRGDTTVGPYSKIGGEVSNSVFFSYSNKAHDGFVGNSVIGEWCNIGADTNTSNLKNNYETIKLWNYATGGFKDTGLQFCGLLMGDHSKCGINTMFNTGTIVGVSANIFGEGFPRTFIPSFAWGGASGFTTFQINKALDTAAKAMGRRNVTLSEADHKILQHIYESTKSLRVWEKQS